MGVSEVEDLCSGLAIFLRDERKYLVLLILIFSLGFLLRMAHTA